jgi:hypothetical protein
MQLMNAWLLLFAAIVFAWLAYDAWRISVPQADIPFALTAKGLGQDVSGVPLKEQKKRKDWNSIYGLGDLTQAAWLWGILAVGCAIASFVIFMA